MKHIWKKAQRLIAGVLSTAMLVSLFAGIPGVQAQAAPAEGAEVLFGETGQDYSVQGTNDLGNLLAEEITEASEEQGVGAGYFVTHVDMQDTTATVEYSALEDCTMIVAIYDEAGVQMLASGTTEVLADEKLASVTIDTDTMPEYFMVKVFLLDSFNRKPLAEEYSTPLYTREMQELLNATVADFEQERVLNLDDDMTTNFMVYGEDTILIATDEDTNVVTAPSEDGDVYTVEFIDENVAALQAGDIVAIGSDENVTIIKVASINIEGTTATIVEADVEMEEVFDYVKVEEAADAKDTEVNEDSCEEGVTYVGEVTSEVDVPEVVTAAEGSGDSKKKDYYAEGSLEVDLTLTSAKVEGKFEGGKKFEFLDKKLVNSNGKKVTLSGDATIALTAEVNVYLTKAVKLVEFYIGVQLSGNIKLEAEAGGGTGKIKVGSAEIVIPTCTLVNVVVEPKLVFKAEGEVSVSMGVRGKVGFKYDSSAKKKVQPVAEASMDFLSVSAEGSLGVGFAIEPTISDLTNHVVKVGLSAELLLETKVSVTASASLSTEDEGHDCIGCFAGDLSVVPSLSPKIEFLTEPIELDISLSHRFTIGQWYWSVSHMKFGLGECPYIKPEFKPAQIQVVDQAGNPLKDATVVIRGKTTAGEDYYAEYTTDNKGAVNQSIPKGDYVLEVSKQYYRMVKRNLKNWTESRKLAKIRLYKYENIFVDPIVLGDGRVLDSTYANSYIKKVIIKDDNYTFTGSPFNASEIERVEIESGVTTIPGNLFSGSVIQKMSIPENVTDIGGYAFQKATLPEKFELGSGVRNIGYGAFYKSSWEVPEIVIENGMTIAGNAFSGLNIGSIVLNGGEEVVINSSFGGATIEQVKISEDALKIPGSIFKETTIKNITIPDNITEIANYAFTNATLPEDFELGAGVRIIGYAAFKGTNWNVPEIVIEDGMTFDNEAFFGLNIKTLVLKGSTNVIAVEAFASATIGKVEISEEVSAIPGSIFKRTTIEEITIPPNITTIGNYAFTNATLPDDFELGTGVQSIGYAAFKGSNWKVSEVVIEDGTTLGGNVFSNMNIDKIVLKGSTDVSVGEAFSGSTIGKVEISGEASSIPGSIFKNVTIKEITIPTNITEIGGYAFTNATLPENFEIGAGVESIGYAAFKGTNLHVSEIVIKDGTTLGGDSFSGLTIDRVVLNGSEEVSTNEPFDKATIGRVEISGAFTNIPSSIFYGATIGSITIPANITTIGSYAFTNATLPSGFSVSDSVTVGYNAFEGSTYNYVAPEKPDPEETNELVAETLEPMAESEAVEAVTVASATNTRTFTDLRPNDTYNFYAVKVNADFMMVEEVLASDNLLYVTQITTDESGTATVSYTPEEEYEDAVELLACMSRYDITNAEITLDNIFHDGNVNEVAPQVIYEGETLTADEDYQILGNYEVTETGVYSATIRGINDYCGAVTVSFRVVTEEPVTALVLDKQAVTLTEGESTTLAVSYTPETTFQVEVVWSSSDETVVTVENGVVTAVSKGTATITATSADNAEISASCTVNVECGHSSLTEVAEQASTCMEQGWDAYKSCKCGQLFDAEDNAISEIPYRTLAACDYNTEEWEYREEDGHAHVCRVEGCGKHDTVEEHTPNIPAPTEEEAQVCTVCGYVMAEALEVVVENPFGDVKESDWFYPYVVFAYKYNLMGGKGQMPDGSLKFDPGNTITRAEFVTMLYSKENKPAVEYVATFTDVPDEKWYTDAILWAAQEEIVGGKKADYFDVNGKITRQEIALILYKYALYKDYDVSEAADTDLSGFADASAVSNWASTGMKWAVEYNVIGGKIVNGKTTLSPGGNAIRAEAATMMKAFMGAYENVTE